MRRLTLVGVLLAAALASPAAAQVGRFPTGLNVSVLRPTAINVNWQITAAPGSRATSTIGLFQAADPGAGAGAGPCVPATALGQINSTVIVPVAPNGAGRSVETLVIPSTVAETALKRGLDQFFYCRAFTGSFGVARNRVTCRQGSSAFANFSIARVELYFENRRREITVAQDTTDLRVFADVAYNGSGIVRAVWEVAELGASGPTAGPGTVPTRIFTTPVDPNLQPPANLFRALHTINQYVGYGDRILLTLPGAPPLPTGQPGTYAVNLRFVEPPVGFEIPVATYYVKPGETAFRRPTIGLLTPGDGAQLPHDRVDFRWDGIAGVTHYRLDIYPQETIHLPTAPGLYAGPATNPSNAPSVFQPRPRDPDGAREDTAVSAMLPAQITFFTLRSSHLARLQPGRAYAWQVRGLDQRGNVVGESPLRPFTFAPK
jgi:hypothetical protein